MKTLVPIILVTMSLNCAHNAHYVGNRDYVVFLQDSTNTYMESDVRKIVDRVEERWTKVFTSFPHKFHAELVQFGLWVEIQEEYVDCAPKVCYGAFTYAERKIELATKHLKKNLFWLECSSLGHELAHWLSKTELGTLEGNHENKRVWKEIVETLKEGCL